MDSCFAAGASSPRLRPVPNSASMISGSGAVSSPSCFDGAAPPRARPSGGIALAAPPAPPPAPSRRASRGAAPRHNRRHHCCPDRPGSAPGSGPAKRYAASASAAPARSINCFDAGARIDRRLLGSAHLLGGEDRARHARALAQRRSQAPPFAGNAIGGRVPRAPRCRRKRSRMRPSPTCE